MDLPPELEYGHVVGRFLLAVADSVDADRMPDAAIPTDLKVEFEPKAALMRVGAPNPATVVKSRIWCTVDSGGRLVDPQTADGVWLVAGQYAVKYGSSSVSIPSHDIEVLASHTEAAPLDLTLAMPPGGPILTPSQYAELAARLAAVESGGGSGGAVESVNGQTGAVTLNAADVSALPDTYTPPAASWGSITGKPSTFTPKAHTHDQGDVSGLVDALAGKADAVGDTDWQPVSLSNGWAGAPTVRRIGSQVYVSLGGLSSTGATSTAVGTIPAGYRPDITAGGLTRVGYTFRSVTIEPGGSVSLDDFDPSDGAAIPTVFTYPSSDPFP